ncbi:MAG: hypothetical protein PHS93_09445, partial [Candidatus Omnitrophica bacterium]|nr:hypothetical protein [Candidatus Omnitrophota bacterium]
MAKQDYILNTYNALKENLEGFNKSEQEFRDKLLSDPTYKDNVHKALTENVQGFNRTMDEFSTLIGVKKKDNSESSGLPLPSFESQRPSQSVLSGEGSLGTVPEVEVPQVPSSETPDKTTQDLLSRATKPLPSEVQPIPHPKVKPTGEIKVIQPIVEQKIEIPDEVKKVDAYHASKKGDYGLSEQILNTIEDDKDGYIYELRAHNQLAKGNFNDAKQNLIQATNLNPNNTRLYPELAIASFKTGDTKTATESADRYIKDVGGVAGGDEQKAINLSNIYAIKGDNEKSDYWAKNAEGIRKEREKNVKADILKTFPDWFYSQIAPLNTPEMFISGMEKIKEAESLPQVLSGVIDATFATLMSSPSGLIFNSVISAGNLVGASDVTNWAFAPVSKLLELNGVDESKFNDWGKFGVQVGNFVPFMMFMKASDLKPTDKQKAISLKITGEKLAYKEPLNADDLKNIDETIATAPKEDITKTVETIDKFVESKKTEEGLKEYQEKSTTPTYRVNNELVKDPKQVIEKVTELKEKGVNPDNIEVDIRNDVEGAKLVTDELNKPVISGEQKPQKEPIAEENQYFIRKSEYIEDDLRRGWSSWNYGQEGFKGTKEELDKAINNITDKNPLWISGFDLYPKDIKDADIRELYPDYWVLVDKTKGEGIFVNSLEATNKIDAIDEGGRHKINLGEGEVINTDNLRIVSSIGDIHILEKYNPSKSTVEGKTTEVLPEEKPPEIIKEPSVVPPEEIKPETPTEIKTDIQTAVDEVSQTPDSQTKGKTKWGDIEGEDGMFLYEKSKELKIESKPEGTPEYDKLTKLENKGYLEYDYDSDSYTLTESGKQFVDAVNSRLQTRQGIKEGTDLFPETANIPELKTVSPEVGQQPLTINKEGEPNAKEIRATVEKPSTEEWIKGEGGEQVRLRDVEENRVETEQSTQERVGGVKHELTAEAR